MQLKLIAAIAVLLLVLASLSVAGCTTQNTQDANALNFTYKAVQVPQKWGSGNYSGETPKFGYKYIGYNATVKNVNAKDRSVVFNFFELRDTQGGVYRAISRYGMEGIDTFGNVRTERVIS